MTDEMNHKNIKKKIKKILTFILFIVSPFICFLWFICYLSDDSIVGMLVRFANLVILPVEILIVVALNIIGFFILRKDKWKFVTLIYLLIQSIVSFILAVMLIRDGIDIAGESIFINDIIKGDSYYHHSVVLMCFLNIISFSIMVIACLLKRFLTFKK